MSVGIRPSQYITTFGPGSITETPYGPYILCHTSEVLRRIQSCGFHMRDLEIRDLPLERGLLGGSRIFSIPDESFAGNFLYPVLRFPTSNLCLNHDGFNVIHPAHTGCPVCPESRREESKSNKFALRFLMACPNGHLDDVPWRLLVHAAPESERPAEPCEPNYFLWRGSGATLRSITIECPTCHASKSLSDIYSSKMGCRGRRPEIPRGDWEECASREAIVVQRGSFQLRLPDTISALSIPPLTSGLHQLIQRDDVQTYISILSDFGLTEGNFRRGLDRQAQERRMPFQVVETLRTTSWDEVQRAIEEVSRAGDPTTRVEFVRREHRALMDAAESGFPPYPGPGERRPWESVYFHVDGEARQDLVPGPNRKLTFRVVPIDTLRVVLVQVGYRRVDYTRPNRENPQSNRVTIRAADLDNPDRTWYPGVAQFGEGLFIELNPNVDGQRDWTPRGPSVDRWLNEVETVNRPDDVIHWNPLAVWWHSLSHRLINALSVHSGYSSNAIRERVYMSPDRNGILRGGILLYTTQPGGDGTMGGLTSLAPHFERILSMALDGIDSCSNDPICLHSRIDDVSKTGAACYSCQLVSETSCEHFNSYLDRRILLDNLP